MSAAVASAAIPPSPLLGRRERLWPTIAVSLALHAAFVALVLVKHGPPPIDLNQKPIVARLAKRGELRPKQFLPRKEEPKPSGPPAAAEPAPKPAPAAQPQPVVAKAPTPSPAAIPPAKAAPAKPQPTRAAQAAPAKGTPSRASGGGGLASVMTQMKANEPSYGDPNGDPLGDSETGEGDPYLALVTRSLQETYVLPSTISDKERVSLSATVLLFIQPDGKIADWRFERRSGNPVFDGALEHALRTARLPPPPPERRAVYRSQGLAVVYRP
ncbi:MAG TPA: TonB C-terminal domain-containing protein [Anaeromyxobacteraceae bacterium]|nr:TonB C-terminal domain-containing protein [Anaeromyxobacteraceae bacterium]